MRDGATNAADGDDGDMAAESGNQSGSQPVRGDAPAAGESGRQATNGAILARTEAPSGDAGTAAAAAGKPRHQQPELPDFWDHRFVRGATPWDAGGVPQALIDYLRGPRATIAAGAEILIPGCGSAWEAAWLDGAGYAVTAVDFSPAAIVAAQAALAEHAPGFAGRLVCADFFTHAPAPPALIYERAFLAALPRRLWPDYAARMAALAPAGSLLAGFFFFSDEAKGPPFGLAAGQLDALLGNTFVQIEDAAVAPAQSAAVFAGRERWQVWRRRG